MAAKDVQVAKTIALAVKDFNEDLILYGLANSCLISEAKALELRTASEAFADRTYQDDGTLTPRSHPNALIEDEEQCVKQVLQIVKERTVTATSRKIVPVAANTICIHGDGIHAVKFAKRIHHALNQMASETV
jgi:UPF0271 protein